jgi:chemotaxis protein MotA
MDLGTIIGLILGIVLVGWSIMLGGNVMAYVDVPSIAIVIGGAAASTMVSIPFSRLKNIVGITRKAVFCKSMPPQKLIADLVSYAEVARRDGILSLESYCNQIEDPFIVRGIQMAVDGTDPELIQEILTTELDNLAERHAESKAVLDMISKYCPAYGMIGTLVGLIAMLATMDDPSKIGAGMAVALITTLYGAMASNMITMPMADKLAKRSAEEVLLKTIIIKGVMSIQSGDNPRVVEQKLLTYLPPGDRPVAKDAEAA